MLFSALTLIQFALSPVGAVTDSPNRVVHRSIAKRAGGDVDISKRAYTDSRWSFYDVGLGACGKTNVASDYIVALNQQQFGTSYPSSFCGKTITMTYNGKTATATIMDSCPGCPYGGLDLSRGLFTHFASEDTGIIYGEWSIAGEEATTAAAAPTTTKAKTTKVTTTTEPARVTTKKSPPTTTTHYTPTTTKTPVAQAAVTTSAKHASSSSSSSQKASKVSSSATGSSPSAAASSASLASSYASVLPSASAAANSTGNATIAEIQGNLAALSDILVRLSSLIVNAIEPDDTE